MKQNTKEMIWQQALALFSQYGYEGVSVKAIAKAVGIKDSSLYNHYAGKQEIFDTILKEATARMEAAQKAFTIPDTPSRVGQYGAVTVTELAAMCYRLFCFYASDEIVSKFRKMLTIEQYASSEVSALFQNVFISQALGYEAQLFRELISQGFFVEADPDLMALQFYSPLFLLLFQCDAGRQPEQLRPVIEAHVAAFAQSHATPGGKP